MRRLTQSASAVVTLKVYLAADHLTAATGKTVAITISKNGGAFGNPNAGATNATEISSGWYKVSLDATDTATAGDLVVRGTATGCDDSEQICQVMDPLQALTTQMTESYAADGVAPTAVQALFLIQQMLSEMSVAGTTMTVKKINGSTTAATFTLNDATSPSSITRAS